MERSPECSHGERSAPDGFNTSAPLPLPHEIIACICSHLDSRSRLAVLLTGWHGYSAALPRVYAQVEMDKVVDLVAGLRTTAHMPPSSEQKDTSQPPVEGRASHPTWPNEASHERKRSAFVHVRRIRVGSWLASLRSSTTYEDPNEIGPTYLPHTEAALAALVALDTPFPRLRAIAFHSSATKLILPESDFEYANEQFPFIWRSPLYALLATLAPSEVCFDMHHHQPRIGYILLLAAAWAASSSSPSLTVNLHGSSPRWFPLLATTLNAAQIRLWPTFAHRSGRWQWRNDTEWEYNVDDWERLFEDINAMRGPESWEVIGLGPTFRLKCVHAEAYAASSFWVRVLLHMKLAENNDMLDKAKLPYPGAAAPCGACGGGAPAVAWWSAPLGEALEALGIATTTDELVAHMRSLDATLPPPPSGPCVSPAGVTVT